MNNEFSLPMSRNSAVEIGEDKVHVDQKNNQRWSKRGCHKWSNPKGPRRKSLQMCLCHCVTDGGFSWIHWSAQEKQCSIHCNRPAKLSFYPKQVWNAATFVFVCLLFTVKGELIKRRQPLVGETVREEKLDPIKKGSMFLKITYRGSVIPLWWHDVEYLAQWRLFSAFMDLELKFFDVQK